MVLKDLEIAIIAKDNERKEDRDNGRSEGPVVKEAREGEGVVEIQENGTMDVYIYAYIFIYIRIMISKSPMFY